MRQGVTGQEAEDVRVSALKRISLFRELRADQLAFVASLVEECNFRPDRRIIRKGASGDCIYIITKGWVSIRIPNGSEWIEIARRGPGDHIGEMSILDSTPRTADVVTQGHCRAMRLTQGDFMKCLKEQPTIALAIMASLSRRLREASDKLESIRTESANERLGNALVALLNSHGAKQPDGTIRLAMEVTRQDLAQIISVRPETISRAIRLLAADGIISWKQRGQLVILNEQALRSWPPKPNDGDDEEDEWKDDQCRRVPVKQIISIVKALLSRNQDPEELAAEHQIDQALIEKWRREAMAAIVTSFEEKYR